MLKSINGIELIDLERIITPDEILEDGNSELSLRPQKINEYIGQDKVKERLNIFIRTSYLSYCSLEIKKEKLLQEDRIKIRKKKEKETHQ